MEHNIASLLRTGTPVWAFAHGLGTITDVNMNNRSCRISFGRYSGCLPFDQIRPANPVRLDNVICPTLADLLPLTTPFRFAKELTVR